MKNIIGRLASKETGLVFLSAPTNSGKTKIIHAIKETNPKTIVLSGERFLEAVLQPLKTNGRTDSLARLAEYNCICIEDLDWYGGREQTEYELAAKLLQLAETSIVFVTGIDLKNRMHTMFSRLQRFEYFEKTDTTESWTGVSSFGGCGKATIHDPTGNSFKR